MARFRSFAQRPARGWPAQSKAHEMELALKRFFGILAGVEALGQAPRQLFVYIRTTTLPFNAQPFAVNHLRRPLARTDHSVGWPLAL